MPKARKVKNIKDDILLAALPDVVFDGWSAALLERAGRKTGIGAVLLAEAFPGGAADLAAYFSAWADQEMLKEMTPKKLKDLRVRDKIALGVRTRLELLLPHREAVSTALSFLGMPPRSLLLPRLVWRTADRIWWAAGDTATDYNHYTKRLLLSSVLTSTTLYWLNNSSPGCAKTWDFLDRRIGEVLAIGQKVAGLRRKEGSKA